MLTFECFANLEAHLSDMRLPPKKKAWGNISQWAQRSGIALEFLEALWFGKSQGITTKVTGESLQLWACKY